MSDEHALLGTVCATTDLVGVLSTQIANNTEAVTLLHTEVQARAASLNDTLEALRMLTGVVQKLNARVKELETAAVAVSRTKSHARK